jgi:tetratricopeptide (TPR) repeat protein
MIRFESFCQEYIVEIEDRNKAIELTNQAIDYLDINKTDDAFLLLTKAISIDSTFRSSFLFLFKVYTQNHNYSEKVVLYLKKAKRIFLEDDEISYYLGEIYRMNSEIENAIQEYSYAIKCSKKNGEDFPLVKSYYLSRGNCYFKLNEFDSALDDYNYSLKLNPNNPNALLNRGICLFKKGSVNDACEDWKKSVILGNSAAKSYLDKYCKTKN